MKIGCLGPKGTFTEEAASHYCNDCEIIFYSTIQDVIDAVVANEIFEGIVPIENSIEGSVNATLDAIIFESNCNIYIKKQLVLPIRQNFLVRQDYKGEKITSIYSHPQSLSQCRNFISQNYKGIPLIECSSNAEAAKIVSNSNEKIASIGPIRSAEIYNLQAIHKNIQSDKNNKTSFVIITKEDTTSPKISKKTTIAFSTENKPGELYKILDIFSLWDLNLTNIVSRPMRNRHKEYVFLVDIEDYTDETDFNSALTMVKRKTSFYKNLGTYEVIHL